jgi:hypothetical protein
MKPANIHLVNITFKNNYDSIGKHSINLENMMILIDDLTKLNLKNEGEVMIK